MPDVRRLPFLLLLLAGCKHPGTTLKAAAPPDLGASGWTTAFDRESGVSIALPPGWRVGVAHAFNPADLMGGNPDLGAAGGPAQEMGAQLVREDAAREKAELQTLREKQGIVLHATDGSKPLPPEEPTSIAVKKEPGVNYGSLDDAAVAEQQDGHREMKKSVVDLPVGKAVRLVAQGQNRIGDVECHVSYVFLNGPDAYVLRMTSTNNPDAIMAVEKGVAQSFRLAKK